MIVQLQVTAWPARNPMRDPLSTYVHAPGGWLFPVGLALLAVAMLGTAQAIGRSGCAGSGPPRRWC